MAWTDADLNDLTTNKGHDRIIKDLTHKNDQLYWQGKVVKSESKLSPLQQLVAGLILLFSLAAGIGGAVSGFISGNAEYCWFDIGSSCPIEEPINPESSENGQVPG